MNENTQQTNQNIPQPLQKKKRFQKSQLICLIFIFISLLLCIALIATTLSYHNYKQEAATVINANVSLQEELDKTKEETVEITTLKQYAQKYNVSTEFLQRFFDDTIVYKGINGITYAPIDMSLPLNSFDFEKNLVHGEDGEIEYHENGVSVGIKGIDVSKYQGDIDWQKVKADGVEFAIIRMGYRGYGTGKIMIDESFEQNMVEAQKAGIKLGVYFFSQAINEAEAIEEASLVIESIQNYDITYPVVFDMEEIHEGTARTASLSKQELTDVAIAFCETVKNAGYTPMVYANIKWFMEHVDLSQLTQYDKWFAQYYKTPFFPYDLQMWQYTGSGKVDGIAGKVDMNICFKEY